jgi:hypothetical protein
MKIAATQIKPVQHNVVLGLCVLFSILYGVWLLPHTVFIRHACLIIGSLLSLPIIFFNWRIFIQRRAIPILLILLLLVWVTIHLWFVGIDFAMQYAEYTKIWKKIALSLPFAMGLGLGLMSNAADAAKAKIYWRILFIGFLSPTLIYLFKYWFTLNAARWGLELSPFLLRSNDINHPFGIHKVGYVFFCLPAVALAVGCLQNLIRTGSKNIVAYFIYLSVLPITLFNFQVEDTRNGFAYAFILVVLGLFGLWLGKSRQFIFRKLALTALLFAATSYVGYLGFKDDARWNTFIPDAKVAIQVDQFDHWKYCGAAPHGYPVNELGKTVTQSNYERIAWAVVALRLIRDNPLGYGVMDLSFAYLGRIQWPEAECLHQSHSAWLDFTLGYGIPGVLLLLLAAILAWAYSKDAPQPWADIGRWGLGSMMLLLITTEISSEIFVNALIFLIVLTSTLSLRFSQISSGNNENATQLTNEK